MFEIVARRWEEEELQNALMNLDGRFGVVSFGNLKETAEFTLLMERDRILV